MKIAAVHNIDFRKYAAQLAAAPLPVADTDDTPAPRDPFEARGYDDCMDGRSVELPPQHSAFATIGDVFNQLEGKLT